MVISNVFKRMSQRDILEEQNRSVSCICDSLKICVYLCVYIRKI